MANRCNWVVLMAGLCLATTAAHGTHYHHRGWDFDFSDGLLSGFTLDNSGVHRGVIIVSPPLAVSDANEPSRRVEVTLGLFADPAAFGTAADVRHSMDGLHWSDWTGLDPRPPNMDGQLHWSDWTAPSSRPCEGPWVVTELQDGVVEETPGLDGAHLIFDGVIQAPDKGPHYLAALEEWRETQQPVLIATDPFLRWAGTHRPEIFAECIPFVGYIQFRVVGDRRGLFVRRLHLDTNRLLGTWRPDDPEALEQFRSLSRPWDFLYPGVMLGVEGVDYQMTRGDANGNGMRDAGDVVTLENHLRGEQVITDPVLLDRLDANADGDIDDYDLRQIDRVLLRD